MEPRSEAGGGDPREAEAVAFLLALARQDPVGLVRLLATRLSPAELRGLGQALVGFSQLRDGAGRIGGR